MTRFCLALGLLALPALAASAQTNLEWATPQGGSESVPADAYGTPVAPDNPNFVPVLPDAPTPVPIDGGLIFLAAAGAGLAAKRLRDRRRAQPGSPSAL